MRGLPREVSNEGWGEIMGVGRPIYEAGRLEWDGTLVEQPRPHHLIPIIGFLEESFVMFEAE